MYGYIDFLSPTGKVGQTINYNDKEEFDKEVKESYEIGRPIDPHGGNGKKEKDNCEIEIPTYPPLYRNKPTLCKLVKYSDYFSVSIPFTSETYEAIYDKAITIYHEEGWYYYQNSKMIEIGFDFGKSNPKTMLNRFETFIKDYDKCNER